jgi:lipopolysaccharide transport system permease protein
VQHVLALNPLAGVFESARNVTLHGLQPDWRALAIATCVGLVVLQLGYACFMKSKRGFADVL